MTRSTDLDNLAERSEAEASRKPTRSTRKIVDAGHPLGPQQPPQLSPNKKRCNGRFGVDGERRCGRPAEVVVCWSQAAMRVCWGANWNTAHVCTPCHARINRIAEEDGAQGR